MPLVGDITYENNITDFIDYGAIKEELGLLNDAFQTIEDSVVATLNTEINEGGLDLYSANINGVPIYHNKAVNIQQKLNSICSECTSIISDIDKEAKKHRQEELNAFVTALENRIKELQGEISDLESQKQTLKAQREAKEISINDYMLKIDDIKTEIKQKQNQLDGGTLSAHNGGLQAKLIEAQTLLDEIMG